MSVPSPLLLSSTAVLAIDLHRGYLDPSVSSRPIDQDKIGRIIAANQRLFALARARTMPVIHGVLSPENLRGERDLRLQNPLYAWKDRVDPKKPPMLDPARVPAGRNGSDV